MKHQRDTHRWVALSNAAMQLPHLLCPLSLETWEEIVRNAVQSGLVAVRGVAKGDHTQQPIEKRITAGMSVDVLASTVHDGWPVLPLWREVKSTIAPLSRKSKISCQRGRRLLNKKEVHCAPAIRAT